MKTLLAFLLLAQAVLAWPGVYEKPVRLVMHTENGGMVSPGWLNYSQLVSPYQKNVTGFIVLENGSIPVQAKYVLDDGLVFLYWNASKNTTYHVYAGEGEQKAVKTSPVTVNKTFILVNPPIRRDVSRRRYFVGYYPKYDPSKPYCHDRDNNSCYGWLSHDLNGSYYKLFFRTMPLVGGRMWMDECHGPGYCCPGAYTVWPYNSSIILDNKTIATVYYNHLGSEYSSYGVPWPPEKKYPGENKTILVNVTGNGTVRITPEYKYNKYSCDEQQPNTDSTVHYLRPSIGKILMTAYKNPARIISYRTENRTLPRIVCPGMLPVGSNVSVLLQNLGTEPAGDTTVTAPGVNQIISWNKTATVKVSVSASEPSARQYTVFVFKEGEVWRKDCVTFFYSKTENRTGSGEKNQTRMKVNYTILRTYYFKHPEGMSPPNACPSPAVNTSCFNNSCFTVQDCIENQTAESFFVREEQAPGFLADWRNGTVEYRKVFLLPNPLNETITVSVTEDNLTKNVTIPDTGLEYYQNLSGKFLSYQGPFNQSLGECLDGERKMTSWFRLYNNASFPVTGSISYENGTGNATVQANSSSLVPVVHTLPDPECKPEPEEPEEQEPEEKQDQGPEPSQPAPSQPVFGGGGGGIIGGGGPVTLTSQASSNQQKSQENNTIENVSEASENNILEENTTSLKENQEDNDSAKSVWEPENLPLVVFLSNGTRVSFKGDAEECRITAAGKQIVIRPGEWIDLNRSGETSIDYDCVKGNASLAGKERIMLLRKPLRRKPGEKVVPAGGIPDVLLASLPVSGALAGMLMLKKVGKHKKRHVHSHDPSHTVTAGRGRGKRFLLFHRKR